MPDSEARRGRLYAVIAVVLVLAGAALWLPSWWEARTYRATEAIAGVESPIREGTLTDARGKVETGQAAETILAAIGRPSLESSAEGTTRHDRWIYYYADGTMTLNLTDGAVVRIAVDYGPPRIPTSRRPR